MKLFLDTKKEGKTWLEAYIEAKNLGYDGPPVFAVAFRAHLIRLGKYTTDEAFLQLLEEFLISPNILHNGMGLTKTLLSCFSKEWLDENNLTAKLQKLLRRNSLSSCKGSDLRYLVLNWEQFIIPSQLETLTSNQQKLMHSFFKYWSEILWISYQSHTVQTNKAFRLLFKCRIFQLINLFERFPSHWDLHNLYVHNVLAHYSDFFDKTDLLLCSTEQGEQSFARWVRFSKNNSNHDIKFLFKNFLFQETFSQDVEEKFKISSESSSVKSTVNMMRNFGMSHKWKDVHFCQNMTDFNLFLVDLKKDGDFTKMISHNLTTYKFRVGEEVNKHFKNAN